VIDARTRKDLTQERRDALLKVDFKSLPLDQAVKVVRGSGRPRDGDLRGSELSVLQAGCTRICAT